MRDVDLGDDDLPIAEVIAALADGKPRTIAEIADTLTGVVAPDDLEIVDLVDEVLDDEDRFFPLADERWLDLRALLAGRCLTHRLSGLEAAVGAIGVEPDIEVGLMSFGDEEIPFVAGGTGLIVLDGEVGRAGLAPEMLDAFPGGALSGPEGWLEGAAEGRLVELRPGLDGVDHRVVDAGPAPSQASVEGLAETFARVGDPELGCAHLWDVLVEWLAADPDALAEPDAPIADLIEAAGLELRDGHVGPRAEKWTTPFERRRAIRREMNRRVFGFEACCQDALDFAETAFLGLAPGVPPRAVAQALAHGNGNVAEALAATMIFDGDEADAEHALRVTNVLASAGRPDEIAGVHYVRAAALERLGRALDAEQSIRAALRADPDHRAANEALADYLEDRGDVDRALACLRRAEVGDDDPQMERLRRAARARPVKVGRNAPCPCGSGRKFKACCADRPALPAEVRFTWLYEKALAFATHPARRETVRHLATHVAGADAAANALAATDRRLAELALFDDGLLEQFLAERGPLLPAGEADLAAGWTDRPLAVLEVLAVDDAGVELRDATTGSSVRVAGGASDVELAEGDLLTGRPLPDGEAVRLGGPVLHVPMVFREQGLAIASDPAANACDWATWLGRLMAPPELRNREGDALVICTATYRVPEAGAARAALARVLEPGHGDGDLVEEAMVDGDVIIRGTVVVSDDDPRDGGAVVVSTNSVERLERLRALVEAEVEGAVLVGEERESADALLRAAVEGAAPEPEPVPPEAAAVVAEYLADYARRWVDMPVPALGGLTPRQALDDPTRREDLMALVRDIERTERGPRGQGGGMPASVVREELGLDR